MKKILLLSDTHSFLDDKIIAHCNWADEIWHAGDIGNVEVADKLEKIRPMRAVYGNIDGKDLRVIYPLDNPPQLFICGHSHILKVMRDQKYNMLCMNPGAAGVHGFHKMRTMIRFSIEAGKILQPEVIELGKRGSINS